MQFIKHPYTDTVLIKLKSAAQVNDTYPMDTSSRQMQIHIAPNMTI